MLNVVAMNMQEVMAASREQPVGNRLNIAMVSRAGMHDDDSHMMRHLVSAWW